MVSYDPYSSSLISYSQNYFNAIWYLNNTALMQMNNKHIYVSEPEVNQNESLNHS